MLWRFRRGVRAGAGAGVCDGWRSEACDGWRSGRGVCGAGEEEGGSVVGV